MSKETRDMSHAAQLLGDPFSYLTRLQWEIAVLTAASIMACAFSGSLSGLLVCSVNRTCDVFHKKGLI